MGSTDTDADKKSEADTVEGTCGGRWEIIVGNINALDDVSVLSSKIMCNKKAALFLDDKRAFRIL